MLIRGGAAGAPGVFTAASARAPGAGRGRGQLSRAGPASTLVLSAPAGAAQVTVTEVAGPSRGTAAPGQDRQRRGGKHTVVLKLRRPPGAPAAPPFAVVITPLAGSGPVYAGRVITASARRRLQSILPVPAR